MGPWGEMADKPTQDFMKMLLLPGVFTLFPNRPLLGGQQDIFSLFRLSLLLAIDSLYFITD